MRKNMMIGENEVNELQLMEDARQEANATIERCNQYRERNANDPCMQRWKQYHDQKKAEKLALNARMFAFLTGGSENGFWAMRARVKEEKKNTFESGTRAGLEKWVKDQYMF